MYDFYIKKDPGEAPKKVKVKVCRSGDIHHTRSIRRRQLKGTARDEMKKDLKSAGVSKLMCTTKILHLFRKLKRKLET